MKLEDYTLEEIKAEYLKRKAQKRAEWITEKAKVVRCRSCEFFGTVDVFGKPLKRRNKYEYCPFAISKKPRNGKIMKSIIGSDKACDKYKKFVDLLEE